MSQNADLGRRGLATFAGTLDLGRLERRLTDSELAVFFDPEVEWVAASQSPSAGLATPETERTDSESQPLR